MKVAITADVHLRTKEGYPERYNALRDILNQIQAEHINFLFIAGDLFDKEFHDYSDFEKLCKENNQVHFHIIPGNHDWNISAKTIVGENIHTYNEPTVVEIGSTSFMFIPYEEKTTMVNKISGLKENIKGKEWCLIGHGDYYSGSKELNPLEPGTYMPLSRINVETYNPRMVFLGHIHKPVALGNVYYMGSPCGIDISETGKRTFIIFDTEDKSVDFRNVNTDIYYFEESFILIPSESEIEELKQNINNRINKWNITPSEYGKVNMRVKVKGYSLDKSAVVSALNDGFASFHFYKNESPNIEELRVSNTNPQKEEIASRVMKLIDEVNWGFGGDEPEKEFVKMKALEVIYGK